MPPADSANISQEQTSRRSTDSALAASSVSKGGNAPNGAVREQGAIAAESGSQQLAPAKSGKLESKERISSLLYPSGRDSAMQPEPADTKGSEKMGCFGRRSQAKESNKPCIIF